MHEITRLLYPTDPFIPKNNDKNKHQIKHYTNALKNSIEILDLFKRIGGYEVTLHNRNNIDIDIKEKVSNVYKEAWKFVDEEMIQEGKDIFIDYTLILE